MPTYDYSYNLPSFQSMMGANPMDILGLLQGYKSNYLGQQISGEKELAGMGYDSQKELAGMGYGSQKELAGMGYQSQMEQLMKQLSGQKELAGMGYQSQKDLQTLGGQQTLSEMRESARLKEQQDVIAFLRQQGLKSQADWEQRQKQNQMSQEPYYGMSNRQNLVPYGFGGGIWPGPSRR